MSNLVYLLKDKKTANIKQDQNGMLCMFTSKDKAYDYTHMMHEDDKDECEVFPVDCTLKETFS